MSEIESGRKRGRIRQVSLRVIRHAHLVVPTAIAVTNLTKPVLFIPLLLGVLASRTRLPGWLRWVLGVPYFAACWIGVLYMALGFLLLVHPLWAIAALLPLPLLHWTRKGIPQGPLLAGLWLSMGWCVATSGLWPHMGIFALFTALFVAGGVFTRGLLAEVPLREVSVSISLVLCLVRMETFYDGYEARSYGPITLQEGVRGIYPQSRSDPVGRELTSHPPLVGTTRVAFLMEDCDPSRIYAGVQWPAGGRGGLALIDRERRTVMTTTAVGVANENAILDCEEGKFLIGDNARFGGGRLYVFPAGRIEAPEAVLDSAVRQVVWIERAAQDHKLYVSGEGGQFSVASFPPDGASPRASPEGGKFFLVRRGRVVAPRGDHVAWSERRGLVYRAIFREGKIVSSRIEGGQEVARRSLGRGLRYVAYSERFDVVLADGYTKGNLYVLDPETLEVRRKLYIGKKGKWITFSRDGSRALVATAAGGFEIDLARILE